MMRRVKRLVPALVVMVLVASLGEHLLSPSHADTPSAVPGESYQICPTYNADGSESYTAASTQYLTSPYAYHALASGSQSYTVAEYQALLTGGASLPPLPNYISNEDSSTMAAEIFASGQDLSSWYDSNIPNSPIIYFFEGGNYTNLSIAAVSGDEFLGGSTTGFPEPVFDNQGNTGGIDGGGVPVGYDGGVTTLALPASNTVTITTTSALPQWMEYVTFGDGVTEHISSYSGTSVTLADPVTEPSGTQVWFNGMAPFALTSGAAAQGASSISLSAVANPHNDPYIAPLPVVAWGNYVVGTHNYQITSASGTEPTQTMGIPTGGLDTAVAAHTPVYYNYKAGGVTVSYLDITHDINYGLSGVISTGAGWTITHNNIHDGYSDGTNIPDGHGGFLASTAGTASGNGIFGDDENTIEYNCLSRMGNDAMAGWYGKGGKFNYNEIYESSYQDDPGCGCTASAKWWGTLNDDIVGNAWIDGGIGAIQDGDGTAVWMDNGNTGTNISDNYFDHNFSNGIESETGFNLNVTNNLFQDDNWNSGSGCGNTNCNGEVKLNQTGGFHIPGSRYDNQVNISGNQFINDWGGVAIKESNLRNCMASGEGWPQDAAYCTGGFPTTATAGAGGQYYFSHQTNTDIDGEAKLRQAVSAGSTTIVVQGDNGGAPAALAVNDQVGFNNPTQTTANDTKNVTTFTGTGTLAAVNTAGYPASGQLRVGTTAAGSDGGGGFTGAILSYNGTSGNMFHNVALVRGTGTIQSGYAIQQVQPYKVVSQTCTANDCAVTITPGLATAQAAGDLISQTGTCDLFATSAATPTSPLAPNGTSYFDGCQWGIRNISVTGNSFTFNPLVIAAGTTTTGHVGTTCTAEHADNCGTNFMQFQTGGGQPPYNDSISENAMVSQSALTGCPAWDSGCATNPFTNLNALSNPPNAPSHNGEAAWNDVWSGNTYNGPWAWNAYDYGQCSSLPSDSITGKSLPSSPDPCNLVDFAHWQSDWAQDVNSTLNSAAPPTITITSLADDDSIHGSAVAVAVTVSPNDGGSITGASLSVDGGSALQSLTGAPPYTFNLNTTGFKDGQHTITVTATDDLDDVGTGPVTIKISNGDLNSDGSVNISDLAIMAAHWGQTDSAYTHGNITGQNTVNISDLAILAANWGASGL